MTTTAEYAKDRPYAFVPTSDPGDLREGRICLHQELSYLILLVFRFCPVAWKVELVFSSHPEKIGDDGPFEIS
jgi:hypothetical protein